MELVSFVYASSDTVARLGLVGDNKQSCFDWREIIQVMNWFGRHVNMAEKILKCDFREIL